MGKTVRRSRMGKTVRRSRMGKIVRRSRISKKLKKKSKHNKKIKGGMMDHYESIGVSKDTLERDLHSAIKYQKRDYLSKSRFNAFIKDFANKEDHSQMGYTMYGKKNMIKEAKKELDKLDAKLKTEAIVRKIIARPQLLNRLCPRSKNQYMGLPNHHKNP